MDRDLQKAITEISAGIISIEKNTTLYEEARFNDRADAIDFIDFHIIDRINSLPPEDILVQLQFRAQKLKLNLEQLDINLFNRLREKIRAGISPMTFRDMISNYVYTDTDEPGKIGYDNLDNLINSLLCIGPLPDPVIALKPEMVFYQQTPARIIFELTERAQLQGNDVFFDIGSGLGQAAILVHLLSGATTKGVEYEPAYFNYANACATDLNLLNVAFYNADALKWNYSDGTVFFLYTPFGGTMLQKMLDILLKESQRRPIKIFTYGPCSIAVAVQSWLHCLNGNGDSFYQLYEFEAYPIDF